MLIRLFTRCGRNLRMLANVAQNTANNDSKADALRHRERDGYRIDTDVLVADERNGQENGYAHQSSSNAKDRLPRARTYESAACNKPLKAPRR